MGKGWKAARSLLASNLCVTVPNSKSDSQSSIPSLQDLITREKELEKIVKSPRRSMSTGRGFRDKGSCAICLESMRKGDGKALFTAECSHMFHFSCIASNVQHGNRVCPVCRATWADLPWSNPVHGTPVHRVPPSFIGHGIHHVDPVLRILNESIQRERARFMNSPAAVRGTQVAAEPTVYDDDEEILPRSASSAAQSSTQPAPTITSFAETSAVPAGEYRSPFTVLINVRAPSRGSSSSRAPIDLVTVLDVSGSMAGTKLALVKSAMEFVISQMSSQDRLSVISFSTSATRLFSLKRMDDTNKRRAVRAVQSLTAVGGTNIGDGLRKANKVLTDRRYSSPVTGVILLSDGQDTSPSCSTSLYRTVQSTPVHTFGFGGDHDATTLHGISEASRGTFSFVRALESVRDAFAQCIGGLLSVVSQGVELQLHTVGGTGIRILKVENGGFESKVAENGSFAEVKLGDLYAEEERDVMVQIELGKCSRAAESVELLRIGCTYRNAVQVEQVSQVEVSSLSIRRPISGGSVPETVSLEVDRQRNRLLVSESMAMAGSLADSGNLSGAQEKILSARRRIEESAAFAKGDLLSKTLHADLGEVLQRMENRRIYEESGRAYALSAHSSHSHQRATTRHGSDVDVYGQSYQTASMTEMLHMSQTFGKSTSTSRPKIGRSKSSRKVNPSMS